MVIVVYKTIKHMGVSDKVSGL